jgi:pimeloyl-ACP methyl ester carboxylesterase
MTGDAAATRFADVRLASGLRLRYAETGPPGGAPVLFLHGWPDSWFSWSRVLPLLPGTMRCLAIDQRGFGDSDKPDAGYTIPQMADDALAFLDALGIDRAAVAGHSFGTFVARQAAIAQPRRIAALALIGTGFEASNPVTREVQASLRDLADPIPVDYARDFQAGTIHHPVPPAFFDRLVAESLKLPPRLWRLTFDGLLRHDDTAHLARIETPALLLWGDRDALFPREDQDRFLAAVPSSRLTVYSDTGHCANWERPEQVASDLAGFLGNI